jgi:hypothetical protein
MKTGCWPAGEIDHIDRNPWNNRWDNLRDVDRCQNIDNRDKSRDVGVWMKTLKKGKVRWVACTRIRGRKHYTYHDTEAEALESRRLMVEKRTKLYWGA